MPDTDDLCVWPDGTYCWGDSLEGYLKFMSDDYVVLKFGTLDHDAFSCTHEL